MFLLCESGYSSKLHEVCIFWYTPGWVISNVLRCYERVKTPKNDQISSKKCLSVPTRNHGHLPTSTMATVVIIAQDYEHQPQIRRPAWKNIHIASEATVQYHQGWKVRSNRSLKEHCTTMPNSFSFNNSDSFFHTSANTSQVKSRARCRQTFQIKG